MVPRLYNGGQIITLLIALVLLGFFVSFPSKDISAPQSLGYGVKFILDESQVSVQKLPASQLLRFPPDPSSTDRSDVPGEENTIHREPVEVESVGGENSTEVPAYSAERTTFRITSTADYVAPRSNPNQSYMFGHWKLDRSRRYQYWLSDREDLPYNKSLVASQQIERHSRISQMCEKLRARPKPPLVGHRSNIVSLNHILYCPILKAGSTNMLRLLCWLVGPKCSSIPDLHPHNNVPQFLKRANNVAVDNTPEFKNYFSFAIVRNPWKRLVSVYIQKFVETHQGIGFCEIKRRFPALYRKMRRRDNYTMTFNQYITMCVIGQYVDAGGIFAQNGHWRPQYHMCSFCYLDYTFIGKMETMSSDERVIINAFGFKDTDKTIHKSNKKLLPNEKAHTTTLLYDHLWSTVDSSSIQTLVEIYQTDIDLFDYPNHPLK